MSSSSSMSSVSFTPGSFGCSRGDCSEESFVSSAFCSPADGTLIESFASSCCLILLVGVDGSSHCASSALRSSSGCCGNTTASFSIEGATGLFAIASLLFSATISSFDPILLCSSNPALFAGCWYSMLSSAMGD